MKEPVWVFDGIVESVHSMLLTEHGDSKKIKDTHLFYLKYVF